MVCFSAAGRIVPFLQDSLGEIKFSDLPITTGEKIVHSFIFGIPKAQIYSLVYENQLYQGEDLSTRIYIENTGQIEFADELVFTIINPAGEKIYEQRKQINLVVDDMGSFKFIWNSPFDAEQGKYYLKIELGNVNTLIMPVKEAFWIN